jgi:hypothetical protein
VRFFKTRLAAFPLALVIGGIAIPSVNAQNLENQTGAGPRGTAVAPSTNPSQVEPTPRPPAGMEKSGTPIAHSGDNSREAMSGNAERSGTKPKGP